jgi:hypothetical protein
MVGYIMVKISVNEEEIKVMRELVANMKAEIQILSDFLLGLHVEEEAKKESKE